MHSAFKVANSKDGRSPGVIGFSTGSNCWSSSLLSSSSTSAIHLTTRAANGSEGFRDALTRSPHTSAPSNSLCNYRLLDSIVIDNNNNNDSNHNNNTSFPYNDGPRTSSSIAALTLRRNVNDDGRGSYQRISSFVVANDGYTGNYYEACATADDALWRSEGYAQVSSERLIAKRSNIRTATATADLGLRVVACLWQMFGGILKLPLGLGNHSKCKEEKLSSHKAVKCSDANYVRNSIHSVRVCFK